MVVQHNLQAMNSNRMLGVTTKTVAGSTEKLSSGYRINRAADDAAGLSISEKMRRQIRGLTQATINAQDGISSVQTAEGALAEVHDMLHRLDELATKAANGTMSQSDRQNVQDEIDNLLTEIDRVSETTKFNETYLLKGSTNEDDGKVVKNLNAKSAGIDGKFKAFAPTASDVSGGLKATKAAIDGFEGANKIDKSVLNADTKTTVSYTVFQLTDEEVEKIANLRVGDTYDIGGTVYSIVDTASLSSEGPSDTQIAFNKAAFDTGNTTQAVNGVKAQIYNKMTEALSKANKIGTIDTNSTSTAGTVYNSSSDGQTDLAMVSTDLTNAAAYTSTEGTANNVDFNWIIKKADVTVQSPLSMSLHVGSDSNATNKIDLQIDKMNSRGLGIEGLKVTGTSAQNATFAIDAIQDAINKVSNQRSTLGAVQNRLEHTIKNVDNVIENTTSAESAIRDTDMANEMVKFSNSQILQQAGQSMLAQANQSNQGVLSLLG